MTYFELTSFLESTETFFCSFLTGSFFLMGLLSSILCALTEVHFNSLKEWIFTKEQSAEILLKLA